MSDASDVAGPRRKRLRLWLALLTTLVVVLSLAVLCVPFIKTYQMRQLVASAGGDYELGASGDLPAWLQNVDLLKGVELIDLSNSPRVDDEFVRKLAGSPVAQSLIQLDLSGTRITDATAETLIEFSRLDSVSLSRTELSDTGMRLLSRLTRLNYLGLCATRITDEGLASLASLKRLDSLLLSGTEVTDEGLQSLAGLPLTVLWLGNTRITDDGIEIVADSHASRLRNLDVRGCRLTNACIAHLARCDDLGRLHMPATRVTDAGLLQLAGSKAGRSVYELRIDRCSLTPAGAGRAVAGFDSLRSLVIDEKLWTLECVMEAENHPESLSIWLQDSPETGPLRGLPATRFKVRRQKDRDEDFYW